MKFGNFGFLTQFYLFLILQTFLKFYQLFHKMRTMDQGKYINGQHSNRNFGQESSRNQEFGSHRYMHQNYQKVNLTSSLAAQAQQSSIVQGKIFQYQTNVSSSHNFNDGQFSNRQAKTPCGISKCLIPQCTSSNTTKNTNSHKITYDSQSPKIMKKKLTDEMNKSSISQSHSYYNRCKDQYQQSKAPVKSNPKSVEQTRQSMTKKSSTPIANAKSRQSQIDGCSGVNSSSRKGYSTTQRLAGMAANRTSRQTDQSYAHPKSILKNDAYSQLKQQQQNIKNRHEINKRTIEGEKSASKIQNSNGYLYSARGSSKNESSGYQKSKEIQSRFKNDALYKKSQTTDQPSRLAQKPAKSLSKTQTKPFIFSDYRHFIEKQKKMTNNSKEREVLNKSQSILKTIEERSKHDQTPRQSLNASRVRGTTPISSAANVSFKMSSSRKNSNGVVHRKDFIQENKRLSGQMNTRQQMILANRESSLNNTKGAIIRGNGRDDRSGDKTHRINKCSSNAKLAKDLSRTTLTNHICQTQRDKKEVTAVQSKPVSRNNSKMTRDPSKEKVRQSTVKCETKKASQQSSAFSFYQPNQTARNDEKSTLNNTIESSKNTATQRHQIFLDKSYQFAQTYRAQTNRSNQLSGDVQNAHREKTFHTNHSNQHKLTKQPTVIKIEHEKAPEPRKELEVVKVQSSVQLDAKQAHSNEFSQDQDNLQIFRQQRGHYQGGVQLTLNVNTRKDDISNILINSRQSHAQDSKAQNMGYVSQTQSSQNSKKKVETSSYHDSNRRQLPLKSKHQDKENQQSKPAPKPIRFPDQEMQGPEPQLKIQEKTNEKAPEQQILQIKANNNTQNIMNAAPQPAETQQQNKNAQEGGEPDQPPNPMNDTMIFSDKNSLDDYIIGKQIGQGAYAVVRIGLHKPSNRKVAMKIYKKHKLEEPNRRKSVKREIKLMEKMRHKHIIQLYEIIDTQKYVILIMEYIGGGSLHGYLKSKPNRRLEENDAKRIIRQIVEGLRYCHSRCITHRDIKLENLLLDDNNNMKIIDFGFSTCIPNDKRIKIFCGTPSYMAPEIVLKTEYCGPPADIWALGVLMFTIISGSFPYRGATDEELYGKIQRADYHLPSDLKKSLSPESQDLLARLFSISADERPTAKQILQHPWLQNIESQSSEQETAADIMQQIKAQEYLSIQKRAQSQKLDGVKKQGYANYQTQVAHTKEPTEGRQAHPTEPTQINFYGNANHPKPADADSPKFMIQKEPQMVRSSSHYIGGHQARQLPHSAKNIDRRQQMTTEPPPVEINEALVAVIVDKLGYSADEVRRQVVQSASDKASGQPVSFVANLYDRLLNEEKNKTGRSNTSQISLGGLNSQKKATSQFGQFAGVQPSYVPSVKSVKSYKSLNSCGGSTVPGYAGSKSATRESGNFFNNTQPILNLNQPDNSPLVDTQSPLSPECGTSRILKQSSGLALQYSDRSSFGQNKMMSALSQSQGRLNGTWTSSYLNANFHNSKPDNTYCHNPTPGSEANKLIFNMLEVDDEAQLQHAGKRYQKDQESPDFKSNIQQNRVGTYQKHNFKPTTTSQPAGIMQRMQRV